MDETLLKVIILLLSVSFLEFVLHSGMESLERISLATPIAVLALGLGPRWMGALSDASEEKELAGCHGFGGAISTDQCIVGRTGTARPTMHERKTLDDAECEVLRARLVGRWRFFKPDRYVIMTLTSYNATRQETRQKPERTYLPIQLGCLTRFSSENDPVDNRTAS